MPKSIHNKTKRGSQKQRARVHDQYLIEKFPHIFGNIVPKVEAPTYEVVEAEVPAQEA